MRIYRSANAVAEARTSPYRPANSASSGVTEPKDPLAVVKNCHLLPSGSAFRTFVIRSN
ncbi:MAG: hypothetical protein JSR75_15430 [Proteobacteria bacterium]|nr:hypothetical protein [Pseudomonadota bacterium]